MRGDLTPDSVLTFLRNVEPLKDTLRTAYTARGRHESTAEHTWRLCLLALLVGDQRDDVDSAHLIRICLVHDLGEAIRGDIPAVEQDDRASKAAQERADLASLLTPLPSAVQSELLALWDEYEAAESAEAKLAKALDKIETLVQHTQGKNPDSFDYAFNLTYGRGETDLNAFTRELRQLIDQATEARMDSPRESGDA